jgi:hypothetical protein
MAVSTRSARSIVVVAAEDDRYRGALRRAIALAAGRGEPLILYDWEASSLLAEPLPTWWSSGGVDHDVADQLDPEQLDAAGRHAIAEQVRDARSSGVDAFGWLPSDHGPASLAEYASAHDASMIVVPRDLAELGAIDALVNGTARPIAALEREVVAAVVVV